MIRPIARLSWPGLLLWGHLLTYLALTRLSEEVFWSLYPLVLYVPFMGIAMAVLAAASLLWLLAVWREESQPNWVRLTSVVILVSAVAASELLRRWHD